ncbi:MAG TPA: recombinase family protein [Candidatus Eisenbacteria bacterium]
MSGSKSFHSKQFQQLFVDMREGKVNTVLCTALDRVSRSVKDLMAFAEILDELKVEFVCLKQNYDTTTPHGRFFFTMMAALSELERGQTSDRNKESYRARAERGLWNGGQLLGYDLPPDGQKGTLIPNEREAAIVNFAFDTYLKTGSILETAKALNEVGYRTKEYESRRGRLHAASKFSWTSTMWLLTNWGYIAKKEINKKKKGVSLARTSTEVEYGQVDAKWPPIVDTAKFYAVRDLMEANSRSCRNQMKKVRHTYILNHGLLNCGKCNTEMEGTCGTGRLKTKHFYYVCKNRECRLRIPAGEIEGLILERVKELALSPDILGRLVTETNQRLQTELPDLTEKRAATDRDLKAVTAEAKKLLARWQDTPEADSFVRAQLADLEERRKALELAVVDLDQRLAALGRTTVDEGVVRKALAAFAEGFAGLEPYRQKAMIGLVIQQATVSDDSLTLSIHGEPVVIGEKETSGNAVNARPDSGAWLLR